MTNQVTARDIIAEYVNKGKLPKQFMVDDKHLTELLFDFHNRKMEQERELRTIMEMDEEIGLYRSVFSRGENERKKKKRKAA